MTIDGASYTVDAVGNRTQKVNNLSGGPTENYTYDAIYQLTQVVQNGSTTTESYTYDPVGNRLSSLAASPWNYNASNQLTSISGSPGTTFTYDANGNTLSKANTSGTTQYAWDFENRLTQAVVPGAGTTIFKYDPFGRRIQKSGPSGTTNYLYDGANIIEEVDASGNAVARYSMGLSVDEPLAMLRSGATHYYSADGLGSISSLTDGSGAIAATHTYDTFGNLAASAGSVVNPFRYTAREWEPETGLYFYRARYYDPSGGRFLSEDPLLVELGTSLFAYAQSNPVTYADEDGQRKKAQRPPNLPLGTKKKYWKPFQRGLDEALNRLKSGACEDFFSQWMCKESRPQGPEMIRETEYRFLKLPQGKRVAAQTTEDGYHVHMNIGGLFLKARNGGILLPDGTRLDLGSRVNVQALILLHELGHQLRDITAFTPDLDAATNAKHTLEVIHACFPEARRY